MGGILKTSALALILFLASDSTRAALPQIIPAKKLTLDEVVALALRNYPAIHARLQRLVAARGEVDLAKMAYLPRTDTLWQSSRATANNTYGLLFPQSVLPPISGPVLANTTGRSVWGSGAGVLFSWEPFDFGYRRAEINIARAGEEGARAEAQLTRVDVGAAAANLFLSLLSNEQVVRAAQANVNRREAFAKSVRVLVTNGLRPGADGSRADAELAVARNQLIEAETAVSVSRAELSDILGIPGTKVEIDGTQLLAAPPAGESPPVAPASHPAAVAEKAQVDEAKARELALARSYVPRFFSQAAYSGRGSGANTNGTDATGLNGLGLERANWAVGLTISFPVLDFFSLRARKRIEAANRGAEEARYDQTLDDLSSRIEQAQARLTGARREAENTPIELQAARDGETQARARYDAGLATIVEVTEAQSLLVQAEIDDALARLNIWRTWAGVAAAQGDLKPLVEALGANAGRGN